MNYYRGPKSRSIPRACIPSRPAVRCIYIYIYILHAHVVMLIGIENGAIVYGAKERKIAAVGIVKHRKYSCLWVARVD